MCIRDSLLAGNGMNHSNHTLSKGDFMTFLCPAGVPVSYTHLRFICDASDSIEHEHQQNIKLAFSGIILDVYKRQGKASPTGVALLAEGVDRNQKQLAKNGGLTASPSSRRAWIEICSLQRTCREPRVALLAEGVDRN